MQWLTLNEAGFERAFQQIVDDRRDGDQAVAKQVETIINDVRVRGDAALSDMTLRYDGHTLSSDTDWSISAQDCAAAFDALDPPLRNALTLAADRIRTYHEAQLPQDRDYTDADGVRLGARWHPVDAAGLYVPGGRAAYPSSLLMNAIPAKVAGVGRLAVITPTPKGVVNPLVLAAAHIAGIDEIWRIGGAQAIAALAYGTQRITPVDVVTGPGNAWVAEAKRQLYGVVGIDMVAGPSEILIIADGQNDPGWIAADLLSQAEHDPSAQAILITDDKDFARQVAGQVDKQSSALATRVSAQKSWENHGVIIIVEELDQSIALANMLAAEHVELAVENPQPLFARIRHAGSIFIGRFAPEAVGDYVAGPNHVLPTGRRARFASGLSVSNFMKRSSFIELDKAALQTIGPAAVALAYAEGLPAHAQSIENRLR